jgi:hypothetical protein
MNAETRAALNLESLNYRGFTDEFLAERIRINTNNVAAARRAGLDDIAEGYQTILDAEMAERVSRHTEKAKSLP